ncbi:hypothetical protein NA57DRAFT_70357 [Rhizodiscina lignyota]|uniref:Uncharacterized protein n=1 Tax=Rhizodiscina lignyota TaxID=1504668 RepID=A0A9P4IN27_9PEZI|nr:hypothetical protein NA57DRAFT_70357 [Rhizodiscina lignyota]
MSDPHMHQHTEQRPQLKYTDSQPPSSYWDNLSKIWLTKCALKELNRRNNKPNKHPPLYRQNRRPLTRSILAKWAKGQQSASEILSGYSRNDLIEVKRFARQGGPGTSDLRGYPEPSNPLEHSTMPAANRPSVLKNEDTTNTVKTRNTSPYSRNFEQILKDHGVFPAFYKYSDGRKPEKPKNLDEIRERAKQRRPSLSLSRFTDEEFEKFQETTANAKKEEQATKSIVSIIEGSSGETKYVCGKIKFGNLQSLVGLTSDYTLTPGNPDLYDGALPEQLDRRIRDRLKGMIIPSTQDDLPIAPNFFLHAKGPDGTSAVVRRQCVYDGALGERGQHQLRSYGTNEPEFDNNAHTITSIYEGDKLSMYTIYTARTNGPNGRQEYYTHLIGSWAMDGDIETFRNGAAAFRNLRDWAKEQRDGAIGLANSVTDQVEGERNSGEEGAESSVTSLHALSDGVDSNNSQMPSPTKRPSPVMKRGRASKRTKINR